jgi:hypothetical protein
LINIVDLLIVFAGWTYSMAIHLNLYQDDRQDPFFSVKFFQCLAIVRLLRFVRLCRYVRSLRILFHGIEKAFQHIVSIGFILLFLVLTFGVIIQVIEKNQGHAHVTQLDDLFNIVSISTITVGDAKRVPLSSTGRILCSFLAGLGKCRVHDKSNDVTSGTMMRLFSRINWHFSAIAIDLSHISIGLSTGESRWTICRDDIRHE